MTTETKPVDHGPLLPVVALVLSVVSLCVPGLPLVTLGLGLYGFLRARKDPVWAPRKQISQMTMVVSGVGLAVFLLAVLPRLRDLPKRQQQLACRDGLTSLYTRQMELKRSNQRFTTHISELPPVAAPSPQLYRLAAEGPLTGADAVGIASTTAGLDEKVPQLVRLHVGLSGECPMCQVTMLCAAQLDGDDTVDVWTISTVERTGENGARIPAGMPWLDVDDVTR